MATSVNNAFAEFIKETVNLNSEVVKEARISRDNLLSNINEFDNEGGFFNLCTRFNVHFGSFSRKTKCEELDDIDLMIGISGNGATYDSNAQWNNIAISASRTNPTQFECRNFDNTLNSTLVLNKFKAKLTAVREYNRSDIRRDGSAVLLNLKSREWSFDIVPCFHTVKESDGRDYYLIPNGSGSWMKTEPTIEQERLSKINSKHSGRVLDTIRLVKYWNRRGQMPTMASYVLETMIVDYFERTAEASQWIEQRFKNILNYIANNIWNAINDSKGIEGNINTFTADQRNKLYERARNDHNKACDAIAAETNENNHQKAINIWRNILGGEFPTYG